MQGEIAPPMPKTAKTTVAAAAVDNEHRDLRASLKTVEQNVAQLAHQVRESVHQVHDTRNKMDDALQATNTRIERFSSALTRLEQFQKGVSEVLGEKVAVVTSKVNERRLADSKIEGLLERHNDTVQNLELRLKQMQKVLAERDMQMLKIMNALEDLRGEVMRFKKG